MTVDEFLSYLKVVNKRGKHYRCVCPAHERGKTGDLAVSEGRDGIVVKCFSGCRTEDVVQAIGLRMTDLFTEPKNGASGAVHSDYRPPAQDEPEEVYPYVDEDGKPLFEVVRLPNKKFRQRHMVNGEYVWKLEGVRRVLYHLPEVISAAKRGRLVVICEGEKDVDALRALKVAATCNPGGAEKWRPEFSAFLKGAGQVVVIVDKDERGRKHAKQVRDSLTELGIPVKLKQAKKGKDAHDHIVKYGLTLDEFVDVREGRMPGVVSSSQMADNALTALAAKPTEKEFYPNPWGLAGIEWVPGRMYMWGGWTGSGKSAAIGQVFRTLAEGGIRAGLITNEMPEADFRNRILCHKGFVLEELEKPWLMSDREKARLRDEIEVMRNWNADIIFDTSAGSKEARSYNEDGGYQIVLFDHISRTAAATQGEEAAIAREVAGFTNLALDFDIPVLVVGQLKNPPLGVVRPRPSIHDFKGSGAIGQEAAMALGMWRPNNSSEDAELWVLKNRHGRSDYSESLRYVGSDYRFEKGV